MNEIPEVLVDSEPSGQSVQVLTWILSHLSWFIIKVLWWQQKVGVTNKPVVQHKRAGARYWVTRSMKN